MKCQCENALCSHNRKAIAETRRTGNPAFLAKSLKECNNQATHTLFIPTMGNTNYVISVQIQQRISQLTYIKEYKEKKDSG